MSAATPNVTPPEELPALAARFKAAFGPQAGKPPLRLTVLKPTETGSP